MSQPSADALRLITHCPWCEEQFQDLKVHLVAEQDSLQLFHFQCQACQLFILAAIALNGLIMTSIGMISDLGRLDVLRTLQVPPLQTDDVIELHQLLSEVDLVRQLKTINVRS